MNCGSSAGTIEYPATPRISATHIAATTSGEGPVGAEITELTLTGGLYSPLFHQKCGPGNPVLIERKCAPAPRRMARNEIARLFSRATLVRTAGTSECVRAT